MSTQISFKAKEKPEPQPYYEVELVEGNTYQDPRVFQGVFRKGKKEQISDLPQNEERINLLKSDSALKLTRVPPLPEPLPDTPEGALAELQAIEDEMRVKAERYNKLQALLHEASGEPEHTLVGFTFGDEDQEPSLEDGAPATGDKDNVPASDAAAPKKAAAKKATDKE